MKKLFFIIFFLAATAALHAQRDYYAGTENLRGAKLKSALYEIIKGHVTYPYTSSETDVWDILKETDKDTANPENVILFYTGWSVNAEQEYNNGQGWSREHVWAKSRGDFGTNPPAGTDANNLRPADISVNSARNNRSFDTCSVPYLDAGVETGCFTDFNRWVWQPRDEVKGDVARMIFYMATRYEGENGEPDLEVVDYLPAKSDKSPVHGLLTTLLKWNEEDTVDWFERHRNEVVYSYQQNRNPYIDHPEFVNRIWGNDSIVSIMLNQSTENISIYPNPATTVVHFKNAHNFTKKIYSIDGKLMMKSTSRELNIQTLPAGFYFVIFKERKSKEVKKLKLIKL